jgi:hypothetical protein
MKTTAQWIAIGISAFIMFLADVKHLATSHYNLFLLLLLGVVTVLVGAMKILHGGK